ncbi:MAG: signal recognition particle subunit SRP19/SEC65 family protein [Candidatus Methanomethylophilaceae archaeon]|jgi:signal recognition particle subunit SRP19
MAYDEDNAIVVWPEYFDAERTRKEGRRLPLNLCVKNPDLDCIAKGAIILNLDYRIIEEKSYPGNAPAKRGCVRIEKGVMKKTELLPKLGEILVKNQK